MTTQAASAVRPSAARPGGAGAVPVTGAVPVAGAVPVTGAGAAGSLAALAAGAARTRPDRYWLSRAMSRRCPARPCTPAAAARSARPTATFTSTWLSPRQAAGSAVTVT